MDQLNHYDLVYLGTEYSLFKHGLEAAFELAATVAGALVEKGVNVYSPIVHSHPLCKFGGLDPLDHGLWLPFSEPLMRASDALAVVTSVTWKTSRGLAHEIKEFHLAGKPVWFVDPVTLEVTSA